MDGREIRSWNITSMKDGAETGLLEHVLEAFPVMVAVMTYIRLGDQTHLLLTALKVSGKFLAPGRRRIRPGATTPSLLPTMLTHGEILDMAWEVICRLPQYY
jgi:hypothetical protein